MKGGYQIIDLKKQNITTLTGTTIAGLYAALEAATKPILLEGIVFDSVEQKPTFINPYVSGTSYVFTLNEYTCTVTDENNISLL